MEMRRRTILQILGLGGAALLTRSARGDDGGRERDLRTRLTEEYGLRHPIVGAGMGFYALPELVAAISNAGALGVIGAAVQPPPLLQQLIEQTRALTTNAFGVDLVNDGPFVTDAHIDVLVEEAVPVVVFFWNPPEATWVDRLATRQARRSGCRWRRYRARSPRSTWAWMRSSPRAGRRVATSAAYSRATPFRARSSCRGSSRRWGRGSCSARAASPTAPRSPTRCARGQRRVGRDSLRVRDRVLRPRRVQAARARSEQRPRRRRDDDVRTRVARQAAPRAARPRGRSVGGTRGPDPEPAPSPAVIGNTIFAGQPYAMPKFSVVLPTRDTTGDFEEMAWTAGIVSAKRIQQILPAAAIIEGMIDDARRVLGGWAGG